MEASKLREFAARYTVAWCSREPSRVAEFFSPNGSLRVNDAAPAVGRAAIAEIARGFMDAFPDLQLNMDNLLIRGDRAVYHWTFAGTNTGLGGTGKSVTSMNRTTAASSNMDGALEDRIRKIHTTACR